MPVPETRPPAPPLVTAAGASPMSRQAGRRCCAVLAVLATLAAGRAAAQECPPPHPSVVVDLALSRSAGEPVDAAALRRRARRAALLPESARLDLRAVDDDVFRIESRLDQDFDEDFLTDGSDVTDVQRSGVDQLREVRLVLTWDLTAVVWSDRELQIERAARESRTERLRLTDLVLELYFDWLDAMAEAEDPLVIGAFAARLDAVTDGAFSRLAACPEGQPVSP